MLGDIFISTPYITAYCDENSTVMRNYEHVDVNVWDHLNVLYAHGISHLLGYHQIEAMRNRFDHEKDEDYALMAPFEKMLLDSYAKYEDEYDPAEQGLYDSWNWSQDLDI